MNDQSQTINEIICFAKTKITNKVKKSLSPLLCMMFYYGNVSTCRGIDYWINQGLSHKSKQFWFKHYYFFFSSCIMFTNENSKNHQSLFFHFLPRLQHKYSAFLARKIIRWSLIKKKILFLSNYLSVILCKYGCSINKNLMSGDECIRISNGFIESWKSEFEPKMDVGLSVIFQMIRIDFEIEVKQSGYLLDIFLLNLDKRRKSHIPGICSTVWEANKESRNFFCKKCVDDILENDAFLFDSGWRKEEKTDAFVLFLKLFIPLINI
ncbi:MAG: hypothetical protein GY714_24770 [Desulfobacterales bacterium]|nr:hypothetical protein [Desulfobacterales bacterium]